MPCSLPFCISRMQSRNSENKISLFKCPNKDLLSVWQDKIPLSRTFTMKDVICALHFKDEDILRFHRIIWKDGTTDKYLRGAPKLSSTAVPCIFNFSQQQIEEILFPEPERSKPPKKIKYTVKSITEPKILIASKPTEAPRLENTVKVETCDSHADYLDEQPMQNTPVFIDIKPTQENIFANTVKTEICDSQNEYLNEQPIQNTPMTSAPIFFDIQTIQEHAHAIKLPSNMWGINKVNEDIIAFTHLNRNWDVDRVVVFENSLKPIVKVNSKLISLPEINNIPDLEKLLVEVAFIKSCIGFTNEGVENPEWHETCSGFINPKGMNTRENRCILCKTERSVRIKMKRRKPKKQNKKLKTPKQEEATKTD